MKKKSPNKHNKKDPQNNFQSYLVPNRDIRIDLREDHEKNVRK